MTPTLQNLRQRQRARLAHWSSLHLLVGKLILVLGGLGVLGVLGLPQLAEAAEVAEAIEANDLAWQPATCRADAAVTDSNTTISSAPVFVNATLAREVLKTPGTGRLQINSLRGKPLTVHVFRPSQFDSVTGRIWFVMHGTGRDAERYLKTAAPVAERHQVLVVVLEFSRNDYPNGDAYTLGVVTRGRVDGHAAEEGRWHNPLQTPYMEIERTFSAVREALQSRQPGYFLFGHSAGAQFVHRLLSFVRCPRVLKAVAANAGWYTLPTVDKKWPPFPYSLRGAAREFQDPRQVLSAPLTVLLGTRDTRAKEEDSNLRGTEGAMVQGANRLQRGMTYYEVGQQAAHSANQPFAWKIQLVPGAGHEVAEVIAPAGQLLFAP
jgi:hypothetical protein